MSRFACDADQWKRALAFAVPVAQPAARYAKRVVCIIAMENVDKTPDVYCTVCLWHILIYAYTMWGVCCHI